MHSQIWVFGTPSVITTGYNSNILVVVLITRGCVCIYAECLGRVLKGLGIALLLRWMSHLVVAHRSELDVWDERCEWLSCRSDGRSIRLAVCIGTIQQQQQQWY